MAETPRSRRETAPSSRVCRPPFLMAAVVYTTRKPEAIFEAPSTLCVRKVYAFCVYVRMGLCGGEESFSRRTLKY
ncbi:hypothetical protein Lal_00033289 [Lupinus albus]|nr:hypothetical protein Lal_00033289 [Lupinus albus]